MLVAGQINKGIVTTVPYTIYIYSMLKYANLTIL